MILSFSKARFVDLINAGEKIHTIRRDEKRRWKVGAKIHFWYGSPRNKRTAEGIQPYGFPAPDRFYEGGKFGIVTSVQEVHVFPNFDSDLPIGAAINRYQDFAIQPIADKWKYLSDSEVMALIKNDGLTVEEFREWFLPTPAHHFHGRIIQWKPDPVIYGLE